MATSHAIHWALLDHTAEHPVEIGDIVSVEPGGMPIFRVLGMAGANVRCADERHPAQILPLEGFRWRAAADED